jgi:hypothetical protein
LIVRSEYVFAYKGNVIMTRTMYVTSGIVGLGSSEDVRSKIIAFKHDVMVDICTTGNFSSVEFSIGSLDLR